jgi:ribonuclease III
VDLSPLEQRLGHTFTDTEVLRRALCHRSWVAESTDTLSNERLEFLGDAVLGWVIADIVYNNFSDQAEGALTDLRKSVVNATALAEVAAELRIGEHLLLGRGEDAAGGRQKVSILSDAMEAVLGAVYLDGGKDVAFALIGRLFTARLEAAVATLDRLDYKSALQELTATRRLASPDYRLRASGPDHDKTFFATVTIAGDVTGTGEGRSKKSAEQAAAAAAFDALTALG